MTDNSPTFAILTWGCQMNEDDSDQIASLLTQMGYQSTDDLQNADIIMLNTCSVRAKPEHKVRSKLGSFRELKEAKPDMIIGVCGCMAQREGKKIRSRFPHVDLVVGTAQIERIPEMIHEIIHARRPLLALDLPRAVNDDAIVPGRTDRVDGRCLKSFVTITYGCDNFCAYCIVPYVRGKERSRPLTDIKEEIRLLVRHGCKDVTLLGQNVNSYKGPGESIVDFTDLIRSLDDISGLERIRFMTSHPKDLSDKLIHAIADVPKVCEHIHLPVQSGDNRTLDRMKRGYTVEHYMERIASLRRIIPEIAITTDILVGFPDETEEEFVNTLKTIESIRFDAAFMFAFNSIEGTQASSYPNQLPTIVKNERLRKVIELQNRITIEKNTEQVGKIFEVLVEGKSPKDPKRLTGLTRQNKTVNFPSDADLTDQIVLVRAKEAHLYGFVGELV